MSNAIRACLGAPIPELPCAKTCPSSCCDSGVKRICKSVIVRGQEKALKIAVAAAQTNPSANIPEIIDQNLPGEFQANAKKNIGTGKLVYETGPTSFPCLRPGALACAGFDRLMASGGCAAMLKQFSEQREIWMEHFANSVKDDPDAKDWDKNPLRCGKGEGKYTFSLTEPLCGPNGEVKNWPRAISKSECVEGAYGFAVTSRLQAIKTCDQCTVTTPKTETH